MDFFKQVENEREAGKFLNGLFHDEQRSITNFFEMFRDFDTFVNINGLSAFMLSNASSVYSKTKIYPLIKDYNNEYNHVDYSEPEYTRTCSVDRFFELFHEIVSVIAVKNSRRIEIDYLQNIKFNDELNVLTIDDGRDMHYVFKIREGHGIICSYPSRNYEINLIEGNKFKDSKSKLMAIFLLAYIDHLVSLMKNEMTVDNLVEMVITDK